MPPSPAAAAEEEEGEEEEQETWTMFGLKTPQFYFPGETFSSLFSFPSPFCPLCVHPVMHLFDLLLCSYFHRFKGRKQILAVNVIRPVVCLFIHFLVRSIKE